MIKLAISGCQGRMGQRIVALAQNDKDFQITCLLEASGHPKLNQKQCGCTITSDASALKDSDVIIEFTTPQATLERIEACLRSNVKMVIGTTGITPADAGHIQKASKKIAIVFSSNMSIGVNILFKLTQVLAQKAPTGYQVNMREAHHIHKKDAPSGTAKTLKGIIEGNSEHRVEDIEAIREGEIVGDHKIVFESPEDIITLDHHAKSRDIFVKGALTAAKFLKEKQTGLYTMEDVLGLS